MTADNQQERLNPYWISGFIDGEGCFLIQVNKNANMTQGYHILPEFRLVQHGRDKLLLHRIRDYFGCGVVRKNSSKNRAILEWRVRDRVGIKKLVYHLSRYPLQTKKKKDFLKFCTILQMLDVKSVDIDLIKKIKSTMNRGSSKDLESPETIR